jgi:excisionase family DNA binding protein
MAPERHLTVSEASRVLGMSRTTLLAAEEAGLLTPMRTPGGHRRYDAADLRRYAGRAGTSGLEAAENAAYEPAAGGGAPSEDVAAGIRVAVRPFVQALDADTAGVYLRHDGDLRFAGGFGVPRWLAERLTAGPPPPPVARALDSLRPSLFDPAALRFPEPRATGHGFAVALHRDGGGPLGVLFVVTRHELLPGELRFVEALRVVLAMLVEDQRRIRDLEERLARIAALSAT